MQLFAFSAYHHKYLPSSFLFAPLPPSHIFQPSSFIPVSSPSHHSVHSIPFSPSPIFLSFPYLHFVFPCLPPPVFLHTCHPLPPPLPRQLTPTSFVSLHPTFLSPLLHSHSHSHLFTLIPLVLPSVLCLQISHCHRNMRGAIVILAPSTLTRPSQQSRRCVLYFPWLRGWSFLKLLCI